MLLHIECKLFWSVFFFPLPPCYYNKHTVLSSSWRWIISDISVKQWLISDLVNEPINQTIRKKKWRKGRKVFACFRRNKLEHTFDASGLVKWNWWLQKKNKNINFWRENETENRSLDKKFLSPRWIDITERTVKQTFTQNLKASSFGLIRLKCVRSWNAALGVFQQQYQRQKVRTLWWVLEEDPRTLIWKKPNDKFSKNCCSQNYFWRCILCKTILRSYFQFERFCNFKNRKENFKSNRTRCPRPSCENFRERDILRRKCLDNMRSILSR